MAALAAAGCVAAEEEAVELLAAAAGDDGHLAGLLARRCTGEPLAWIVGTSWFCGEPVVVHPGVYVPRWQSEPLAEEALRRLPDHGVAVDLCTGSGALAAVLARRRPTARVVASDLDPVAVACARANGVDAVCSDLATTLPAELAGIVDVVVSVPPYVPTGELGRLPRDVVAFEPRLALDGGPEGTAVLLRVAEDAVGLLRPGGSLLVEVGGDEAARLAPRLAGLGYVDLVVLADEDGEARGVVARRPVGAAPA